VEGWLYLAVIPDFYSRRVLGWATSDRLKRDLSLGALRMAPTRRKPPAGPIHHSDKGNRNFSVGYQAVLRWRHFLISMSGKCNCYDSSMVETFFKTLKAELIRSVAWQRRQQAGMPSPDISTDSITPSDDIQRSASKAPSRSSGQGRK